MKAMRIHKFGGPEVLHCDEIAPPEPGENQALIRIKAAGVNFIDVYQRTGAYKMDLPFTSGVEAAGIIEKTGPGVGLTPGTRVTCTMSSGANAEFAVVPAARLVPIPDAVDFDSAAAVLFQGMTAHYLSQTTFPAKAGDIALVHAGAGGTGLLLIQMLKAKGTTVFTTVSTKEKAAFAKEAGADEAILYKNENFVPRVKELTGGKGANVVYDSVGLATYQGSLDVLRPRGMLVLFGQSSGKVPPLDLSLLSERSLFLTRPSLAHHTAEKREFLERAEQVLGWVRDGSLRVRIERYYPLTKLAQAHRDLESRVTSGKLLIEVG
jgi:NADPH2:quinone reductase